MNRLTNERLAEIIRDKEICEFCEDCGNDEVCINCGKVNPATVGELRSFWKELSALVKARDEGRVVTLPCKVGNDVFINLWNIKHQKYEVCPGKITNIRYDAMDGSVIVSNGEYFRVWGKDAFPSRAEAEAALSGGGGDG